MKITLPLLVISVFSTTIAARPSATEEDGRVPVFLHVRASGKDIFSDFILTRGRNVTTATGGTHKCDGTNDGANRRPGATPTSALADAADKAGFTFDGEWFDEFEDFLITEIGGVTCDWLLRKNGRISDVGGCQAELNARDRVSWTC